MSARLPIIPTILVVAAAAIMVALGVWQLGRADEKAALIASFAAIDPADPPVELSNRQDDDGLMFRKVALDCRSTSDPRSTAGTHPNGAKGWAHIVRCNSTDREVALGWSREPSAPAWDGGYVIGILDQQGKVVADPPLASLLPLAKPDPNDLPNNHLAYAVQWFLFALTALLIYGFALRSRTRKSR